MRLTPILLLPLAACVHAPPPQATAPATRFFAQAFFAGTTHGDGRLRITFSAARAVTVEGHGHVEADGTLVLDQTVTGASAKPEQREWRIREVAPGHYAGTLSDASGPVSGVVTGNRLHLHFHMKGGLVADQWLDLSADGRQAQNRMVVAKFGMPVAVLDETIRRVGYAIFPGTVGWLLDSPPSTAIAWPLT